MWQNLTVNQFIELREVEQTSYDSNIEKIIDIVSIIEDVDPVDLEDVPFSELHQRHKKLDWLLQEPPKTYRQELEDKTFKGYDNLTLAEYIELTHFFRDDYILNLPLICAVVYRSQKTNEWGHTIIEPYEYNPKDREDLFNELPVTHVYGLIPEFISFKENFENTYAPLFKPEFDKDDDYEPDEEDKLEEEKEKFSWEHFVYNLCEGDLTKSNEVLNLGLIFVFNMLAMKNTFGD